MKKTLGIIGGMGPLAAADLLRKVVTQTAAASDQEHLHVLLDNDSAIPDRNLAFAGLGPSPVEEIAVSARRLAEAGAEVFIMGCNTAHWFLPEIRRRTGLDILNMIELTAEAASRRYPGKTAAILATETVIRTGLYAAALEDRGAGFLLPDPMQQRLLTEIIYGVKAGQETSLLAPFSRLLQAMSAAGADYFILGCTELPILADRLGAEYRFVDATTELARGAVRACGGAVRGE